MINVDLHAHTHDDPADRIPHSLEQLVQGAAAVGIGALAVTLHDRYFDPAPHLAMARRHGVVLISGIERSIRGRHVLLINFPPEVAGVTSLDEIAQLKARTRGLVVAPHPFYPTRSALRGWMHLHAGLFDAVELNAMYTPWIDFNRAAIAWARQHGKPMVGNTDLHVLDQLGTTWTTVDAPADADAICDAIRAGRVRVCSKPIPLHRAIWILSRMVVNGARGPVRR